MAGKICNGSTNVSKIRESRAFCEGRAARAVSATPTNPHPADSHDGIAWQAGVDSKVADDPDGCCGATGAAAV